MLNTLEQQETAREELGLCEKHSLPICLESALKRIFKASNAERIIAKLVKRLDPKNGFNLKSREGPWELFDQAFKELGEMFGEDVSRVIMVQSLKELDQSKETGYSCIFKRQ